jgi:hypothetical protein
MLRIRQVGIEGRDIIDNDIHGWLQTFLQLGDTLCTPAKFDGSSKQYTTFPSLAKIGNKPM